MSESSDEAAGAPDVDGLFSTAMARAGTAAGAARAARDTRALIVWGVLGGALIGLGMNLMTVVLTGAGGLSWGAGQLLAGGAFAVGLILAVLCGGDLFAGDPLTIVACASRRISVGRLARAWVLVYLGNVIGAVGLAALAWLSGQQYFGSGNTAVGVTALRLAAGNVASLPVDLFFLAVVGGVLTCLAVWMAFGARTVAGKVLLLVPAATAIAAGGFDHSIANWYAQAYALAVDTWPGRLGTFLSVDAPHISPAGALLSIVVTTFGNLAGIALLVVVLRWLVDPRRGI
ncbi:MAG: formate/nitrite transporter family protein [Alphaproteobacteria bacterium]|nr:formate/nitrite transporter family protein [Alphaproteobacteria bacterium]